jgi:hypothetical protein
MKNTTNVGNEVLADVMQRALAWYWKMHFVYRFETRIKYYKGEEYKKRGVNNDEILHMFRSEHVA